MKTKVKVFEVKAAPELKNMDTLSGIRDKTAAEDWGRKHGYAVVYFAARKQRVYAEKLQTRVDEQAKFIEAESAQLVMFAEGNLP